MFIFIMVRYNHGYNHGYNYECFWALGESELDGADVSRSKHEDPSLAGPVLFN